MPNMSVCRVLAAAWLAGAAAAGRGAPALPRFDHVVVVIEENRSYDDILGPGSPAAFIQELAAAGASFTRAYAITHPSEPNYLALFSGSTHGVRTDLVPAGIPFTGPNLAAELAARGLTFAGYSQSLPYAGFDGTHYSTVPRENQYMRKHNPWCNWQSPHPGPNQLSPQVNLPFEHRFPTGADDGFARLPTVAFVVPDEQCDMHDGTVAAADDWLRRNLGAYARWAPAHRSLLILTWDEDRGTPLNRIPTIFFGARVRPGEYAERVDHYRVLRTIEDLFGLDHAGAGAIAPLTDIFTPAAAHE
jgi:phosphatidylinositol-3-phosphatase